MMGTGFSDGLMPIEDDLHKNILVVDDDYGTVECIVKWLEDSFVSIGIITAANGEEGLKKLNRRYFSVILTGVVMPRMAGIEFYRKATRFFPGISKRMLFITGTPDKEHWSFLKENNLGYLKKPFKGDALIRVVTQILTLEALRDN